MGHNSRATAQNPGKASLRDEIGSPGCAQSHANGSGHISPLSDLPEFASHAVAAQRIYATALSAGSATGLPSGS